MEFKSNQEVIELYNKKMDDYENYKNDLEITKDFLTEKMNFLKREVLTSELKKDEIMIDSLKKELAQIREYAKSNNITLVRSNDYVKKITKM